MATKMRSDWDIGIAFPMGIRHCFTGASGAAWKASSGRPQVANEMGSLDQKPVAALCRDRAAYFFSICKR